MLAVIFAVSYQSLHIFSHHQHSFSSCQHQEKKNKNAFEKTISEKEDCLVCEFKFATFLKTEIFTFKFHSPFKENPYSFSIKEATTFFCGSLFSHRGPPCN
ncbi:hypothetical protein [Flavobacterium sp.]|uniref:hypothetical protein n=1 Tax=Flavobacterium sp. TaxID=239 RepID=UPI003528C44A